MLDSRPMSWQKRIDLYKKIETHRKRPLIVYVTSKRNGAWANMSTDALPQIIDNWTRFRQTPKGSIF